MAKLSFYDFGPILTHNGTYNGVVGARGLGKTYGIKKKTIRDAMDKGREFILLRRYKEELAAARASFFADVAVEFPEWEFRSFGREAQGRPSLEEIEGETEREKKEREKSNKWVTLGYFVALSTAQRMKGTSFPKVHVIIFDEFIIEKGNIHYLPDEVTAFNNFYSTVDRWNDRVKVFFLANSVRINNPYFLEWEIRPDEEDEFVKRHDGFIVFHFPDSAKFKSEVFETKFGSFIQKSSPEYADYAVGNNFADNHDMLLESKDYTASYMFSLETSHGTFSVWKETRKGGNFGATMQYFVQKKLPKKGLLFTLLPERMNEDKVLMTYRDRPLESLRTSFRTGNVKFDEPSTRNTFIDIFDRK